MPTNHYLPYPDPQLSIRKDMRIGYRLGGTNFSGTIERTGRKNGERVVYLTNGGWCYVREITLVVKD